MCIPVFFSFFHNGSLKLIPIQYGYLQNRDIIEAALYGSVSAGFTVEQVGVPRLDAAEEKWNDGPPAASRLIELQRRIAVNIPANESTWRSTQGDL
jgi:hypothetical protein